MKPLLSIIIPTFNRYQWLQYCLDSLASNLDPAVEVLVGNNASTDATASLKQRYAVYPNLTWNDYSEHVSMKMNWHRMTQDARGTWVLLLSDDDALLPHAISKLLPQLSRNACSLIIASTIFDDYQLRRSRIEKNPDAFFAQGNDALQAIFLHRCMPYLCSTVWRRQQLLDLGGFERSPYQYACDFDTLCRYVLAYGNVLISSLLISRYSMQAGSASRERWAEVTREGAAIGLQYLPHAMLTQQQAKRFIYQNITCAPNSYWWRRVYSLPMLQGLKLFPKALASIPCGHLKAYMLLCMSLTRVAHLYHGMLRYLHRWGMCSTPSTIWWQQDRP